MGRPRKFEIGDRVKYFIENEFEFMRGHVTSYNEGVIRIKGSDGHLYTTKKSTKGRFIKKDHIQHEYFGIRLFDTILSNQDGDSVTRQGAIFWKEICKVSGWRFNYERVHSLEDLRFFLQDNPNPSKDEDFSNIEESVLIFNGHGYENGGWSLSNGEQLNQETEIEVGIFNRNKIVIFSACDIGKNHELSNLLRQKLRAEVLFAYRTRIRDNICFLIESFLLTLIASDYKKSRLQAHYKATCEATKQFKNINRPREKHHPLVMFA